MKFFTKNKIVIIGVLIVIVAVAICILCIVYLSVNETIAIGLLSVVVTMLTAIITVYKARAIFRRTTTMQAEIFFLNACRNYVQELQKQEKVASEKQEKVASEKQEKVASEKQEAALKHFLTEVDLYCKYEINDHLDEELSRENTKPVLRMLEVFKEHTQKRKDDYNNIVSYMEKYSNLQQDDTRRKE